MGKYHTTPEGYTFYDGETWTVGDPNTNDFCVFDSYEIAKWFQDCRSVHAMHQGSQPLDGGYLFMTENEKINILEKEPGLEKFIHQVYGSKEFIQNIKRYCFWLVDATPAEIKKSKILYERVQRVKEFRQTSTRTGTQKLADKPTLFAELRQPTTDYMLIPRVSSERRQYVPMGYVSPDVIVIDTAFALPHAMPYHFGILTSSVHMGWMKRVAGRLGISYRYSNTLVYNTFIWPKSTPWQVKKIEDTANKILEVRARYPDSSFADLYDEITMPHDLRKAHRENDKAVLEAYGLAVDTGEDKIVAHMFELYARRLEELGKQ